MFWSIAHFSETRKLEMKSISIPRLKQTQNGEGNTTLPNP